MEQAQKEMSQEEMKKEFEAYQADWESFVKKLKDDPDKIVTNAELFKTIDFVSQNISGLAQMISIIKHNMDALNHNFQQIVMAIGGGPGMVGKKTQSGIILP
jgi:hypothetical protein